MPFRLHGREVATGLDCVGVVGAVFELRDLPTGYSAGGGSLTLLASELVARGFVAVREARAGDVVLLRPGARQWHLAVVTPARGPGQACGWLHADAGLGRVVETPVREDWDVAGVWRYGGEQNELAAPNLPDASRLSLQQVEAR